VDPIKICTEYKYNGKRLTEFPSQSDILKDCEPVYESMDGWLTDVSEIERYDDLPENAKKYIERISQLSGIKVELVAVGARRDRIITVK